MIENDLGKVLNYMKQYVENKYEHDSEPMLNYKDLQLVLKEIERLNNTINKAIKYILQHTYCMGVDENVHIGIDNDLEPGILLSILKGE